MTSVTPDFNLHGRSARLNQLPGARAVDCGQLATALCRRSAVSRQACQLICVLSRAMGSQFDSLAVHMMPALFKVLVITVQVSSFLTCSQQPLLNLLCMNMYCARRKRGHTKVRDTGASEVCVQVMSTAVILGVLREVRMQVMADAAHDCVKAIVTNSHSHRIVQRIGDAICRDRSPKLRLCCAEYLRQARPPARTQLLCKFGRV